jgi:PKHD-type hydroxylase
VLKTAFGEQIYKRAAGDAVLYPTHYVHRVNPITRGRRLAIVTWIESMVRDPARREVIEDLAEAMDKLVRDGADGEIIRRVEKARLNLLRMWADT